jgi:methylenetetrahydrofolate dehydrogenase (NADP+)/methenyltetrahydrofolate cyclohydrolase
MTLLDGKQLSAKIISNLKQRDNSRLNLHIILVGHDPHSLMYVSMKKKKCEEIGLNCVVHHLESTVSETEVLSLVDALNNDSSVSGFFIQLPLPKSINQKKVLSAINLAKDIDGLVPTSPFTPAVVRGVVSLLDAYQLSVAGKNAVIINSSNLIGIPLQKILIDHGASVTVCNKSTKNIEKISRGADYLFSATGVVGLVTADYIKPGAVVFDIGGGDVNFAEVSSLCSYITPTTGGVGPMTIACLLQNLVEANS